MSIYDDVEETVKRYGDLDEYELDPALAEAERLADEFAGVRAIPYVVPIERYFGFPTVNSVPQKPSTYSRNRHQR